MRDPNASAKDKAEAEILRLLEEEFGGQLDEIMELLGDPPDLTRIPPEFWEGLTASMAATVRPLLERAALAAAQQLVLDPGIGVDWSLVAEDAARWASQYSYNLVTGLTDTTRRVLQEKVTQFIREPGRTIGDLTQDLLDAGFSKVRAEMIAVTETTRAFAEGEKLSVAQAEAYGFRMVAIWHTNRDELVCSICAPADGRPESEWRLATGPPAHPRCILPGQSIMAPGGIDAAAKSFYVGRCIEITLANGRKLAVTQNHPILTPQGWIPAEFLSQGDQVFYSGFSERVTTCVKPDNHHMPALIENVFDALMKASHMASITVPAASEDLHGDGRHVDGNIHIVCADSLLLGDTQTVCPQCGRKFNFDGRDVAQRLLLAKRLGMFLAEGQNTTSTGGMGRSNLVPSLGRSHRGPFESLGFGLAARANVGSQQALAERPAIDTRLASQFVLRFASDIALQQIVQIQDFNTAHSVYDLQCDLYGLYTCNGVLVKNCRCWVTHRSVE